jgi:hypothetical protein
MQVDDHFLLSCKYLPYEILSILETGTTAPCGSSQVFRGIGSIQPLETETAPNLQFVDSAPFFR